MIEGLKDWTTTVPLVLAAIGTWITQIGAKMPTTPMEWVSSVVALGLAIGGIFAKSHVATTT